MSDSIKIANFPDSGSKEAVALKLTQIIRSSEPGKYAGKDGVLDLYAECLTASGGYREIK